MHHEANLCPIQRPVTFGARVREAARVLRWTFRGATRHVVGITIGEDAVCAAHVRHDRTGACVVQVQSVPLLEGSIVDGAIMSPSQVEDACRALRDALTCGGMPRHARAVLAVGGHSVIVKRVTMPKMADEELAESIAWEAEQFIPFDIRDIVLGWERIPGSSETGSMNVQLCVMRRDVLADYLEVCAGAGFPVAAVEPHAWAFRRCYAARSGHGYGDGAVLAYADIGAATTTFAVIRDGDILFQRDVSIGTAMLVEEIAKRTDLSILEARACLAAFLAQDEACEGNDETREGIASIAQELTRNLDFFHATCESSAALAISGPLAGSAMAMRCIAEHVPISVLPLHGHALSTEDERTLDACMLAIGHGLRAPEDLHRVPYALAVIGQPRVPRDDHRVVPIARATQAPYAASTKELVALFEALAFLAGVDAMRDGMRAFGALARDTRIGSKKLRAALGAVARDDDTMLARAVQRLGRFVEMPSTVQFAIERIDWRSTPDALAQTLHACARYLKTGSSVLPLSTEVHERLAAQRRVG